MYAWYVNRLITSREVFCKAIQLTGPAEEKPEECECSQQAFVTCSRCRKSLCLQADRCWSLMLRNTEYVQTRKNTVFRQGISCIAEKDLNITTVRLPDYLQQHRILDKQTDGNLKHQFVSDGKQPWCYSLRYLKSDDRLPVVDGFSL